MDTITTDIPPRLLSDEPQAPRVSITCRRWLPVSRRSTTRFASRNLVRETQDKLRERGMNEHEAEIFCRRCIARWPTIAAALRAAGRPLARGETTNTRRQVRETTYGSEIC